MELIAGLLLALVSLVAYFTWAQQSQAHKSERIPGESILIKAFRILIHNIQFKS